MFIKITKDNKMKNIREEILEAIEAEGFTVFDSRFLEEDTRLTIAVNIEANRIEVTEDYTCSFMPFYEQNPYWDLVLGFGGNIDLDEIDLTI